MKEEAAGGRKTVGKVVGQSCQRFTGRQEEKKTCKPSTTRVVKMRK